MNPNLVANVTLGGLAATAFVPGEQALLNHDYIAGGILVGASIVFFILYELFPSSTGSTIPPTV